MKLIRYLILTLLLSVPVFGQAYYTSIIEADSLGQLIRIGVGEAPGYIVITDSLTDLADSALATTKTLEFYIFYGDTTGYTTADTTSGNVAGAIGKISSVKWTLLSSKDDGSTLYTVTIKNQRTIPLTFNNFAPIVGIAKQTRNGIYIMPYIVGGVGTAVSLKIGTIPIK